MDLDPRLGPRLAELAAELPSPVRASAERDVRRQLFHVSTVSSLAPTGRVCDIGGGVGLFSLGCTAAGMSAVVVDDFRDPVNDALGPAALDVHRRHGVEIVCRDVIADGLGAEPASLDVVTSFESLEHWHHSPRELLRDVVVALRPGGWFVLGVPNCVNLRKRLTVPFGRGSWSNLADWYEKPVFRGHVREPDVGDLRYIAADMGLEQISIVGRNWMGYATARPWVRRATGYVDRLLRVRPSLCSDIYLIGRTPNRPTGARPPTASSRGE